MSMIIKSKPMNINVATPQEFNMSNISRSLKVLMVSLFALPFMAACSSGGIQTEAKYPTGYDRPETGGDIYAKPQSVLGPKLVKQYNIQKLETCWTCHR